MKGVFASTRNLVLLAHLALLPGCATPPNASGPIPPGETAALLRPTPTEKAEAHALAAELVNLSPTVEPAEAERIASCAYRTARELTVEYSVVGPAVFHNFLVNLGVKKRGLCFQWAQDLIARLDAQKVYSMEFRWGVAHRDNIREHNCVVVTAHGQPFREGIVLDCWRNAGKLYYGKVPTDRYPWQEDDWDWRAHIAKSISR